MSYVFDATSGATRGELSQLVLANSFSEAKYGEFVKGWLNDAVTDACRRLQIIEGLEVLDYDATGLVAQPTTPYFQVRDLWAAYPTASGSGEQAVANAIQYRLAPLTDAMPATVGAQPIYYTAKRQAQTDRYPRLTITVVPVNAAGKVAIRGLKRPAIMDSDDDVAGLGADIDFALVAFAKRRAYLAEDDPDMATVWANEYEQALRSATANADQTDEPITVPGAWDC